MRMHEDLNGHARCGEALSHVADGSVEGSPFPTVDLLGDVIAWLLLNQMRSEGTQRKLLTEQSLMNVWRNSRKFSSQTIAANSALMSLGFLFIFYQLAGYIVEG